MDDATHERFNELKRELDEIQDAPDHTADSFLNGLLDTWEQVGEIPEDGPAVITDALSDKEVAIIGTEQAVVDELAERLEGEGADADALAEAVAARFDYAELASMTADEVVGEMRG